MGILVEIQGSKAAVYRDTSGVEWISNAGVEWVDADNSSTLFLSLKGEALDHYWKAFISSFSSVSYATAKPYGGLVDLDFGQIIFSPKAFETDWAPPKLIALEIKYTGTTEDAAVTLFKGDCYLGTFNEKTVVYNIKPKKFTQKLLDVGPDYDGNTVPYPKACGSVEYVEPVRLVNGGFVGGTSYGTTRQTYHMGGLGSAINAVQIVSFESATGGAATKITLASAHGWSNGNSITINGSFNYSGTHVISAASGTIFTIPVAFVTNDSETIPIYASAYASGSFNVFMDGLPVPNRIVLNGDGTFSFDDVVGVGVITMSGTASQTTLLEVVTWGQGRLGGVTSIISTTARVAQPTVACWLTSQSDLIDFLSGICATYTHWIKIFNGTLTLGDMFIDNGSETITESEYMVAGYSAQNAVAFVRADWTTFEEVSEWADDAGSAHYIKEKNNSVIESIYKLASGTADDTSANYLLKTGETFLTKGTKVGDTAENTDDNTSTVVVAVSEEALELEDDIFISGEAYTVGHSYPNSALKEVITPYHDTRANIVVICQNILSILSKDVAEITMPLTSLIEPGYKITFPDTQTIVDMNTYIRARSLIPDFENEKIIIRGEGVIS